jgi:hypothetical protein
MISAMRLTLVGKLLIAAVVATAAISLFVPTVGLVLAIVLAVIALLVLSEGVMSSGAEAGHDAWAKVEAERKRRPFAEAAERGAGLVLAHLGS